MSIVKRIVISLLLIACLAGTAFVVLQTALRPSPSTASDVPASSSTTSTTAGNGNTVDTFPVGKTKNPFIPLAQLPATATTQPK